MNIDLYWSKVEKTDTCWFCTGSKVDGYGQLNDGKKTYKAHRVSWEESFGEIPDKMQVDHLCGLRACVNPQHLRLVSASENLHSRNVSYKPRDRKQKKSPKSFMLYIHDPRFKDEERKSELVNNLLKKYYDGFDDDESTVGLRLPPVAKKPKVPTPIKPIVQEAKKNFEFCKHGGIMGLCKKGCKLYA